MLLRGGAEYPVPAFAIEIISPNESGFKIEQKAFDYFAAGVSGALADLSQPTHGEGAYLAPGRASVPHARRLLSRPRRSRPDHRGGSSVWGKC